MVMTLTFLQSLCGSFVKCRQFGPETKCSGCKTEPGIHGGWADRSLRPLRRRNDGAGNGGNNGSDGDDDGDNLSQMFSVPF